MADPLDRDTLLDPVHGTVLPNEPDAPRPTLPDDEALSPVERRAPLRAAPRRLWPALLAAVVLAALGGAIAVYFVLWRYERTAHLHIPQNANLVARADLAALARFPPAQKHLAPLLEASKGESARATRIEDETGIDLDRDLREVIVSSVDASSFVVAIGGRIPRGRFVRGLSRALAAEGRADFTLRGELILAPGGFAAAQADDGTILVGTSASVVEAALPASEDGYARLELEANDGLTFAVTREAWAGLYDALPMLPNAQALRRIGRARGAIQLRDDPTIELHITPSPGEDPSELARDLSALRRDIGFVGMAMPDIAGEREALQRASIGHRGDTVVIEGKFSSEALDSGFARLAAALRVFGLAR